MPSSSGICQSSSARSGCSRSISATASFPDAASPTTTTSSNERSSATRNERAGRSSSATTTRSGRSHGDPVAGAALEAVDRHADLDRRARARARSNRAATRRRRTGTRGAARRCARPTPARGRGAARRRSRRRRCPGREHERCASAGSRVDVGADVDLAARARCAMPCLTAFSTSGCSTSGGTRRWRRRGGTSM